MWYWHKNRHTDQHNRLETLEINPCINGELISDKEPRIYHGERKRTVSSINWTITYKRMKQDYYLKPCAKTNSDWITEIKSETIKLLEVKVGNDLFDICLSNIFWYISSCKDNIKIKKWDYMKWKSFCTVKETSNKMTGQPTECEKIFANDMLNRGLIPKIYINSVSNKQSQLKNEKGWIDIFSEKAYRWPTDTWKDAQHH